VTVQPKSPTRVRDLPNGKVLLKLLTRAVTDEPTINQAVDEHLRRPLQDRADEELEFLGDSLAYRIEEENGRFTKETRRTVRRLVIQRRIEERAEREAKRPVPYHPDQDEPLHPRHPFVVMRDSALSRVMFRCSHHYRPKLVEEIEANHQIVGLVEVMKRCREAYGHFNSYFAWVDDPSVGASDTLDELDQPLARVIELLSDGLNGRRLEMELCRLEENEKAAAAAFDLGEFEAALAPFGLDLEPAPDPDPWPNPGSEFFLPDLIGRLEKVREAAAAAHRRRDRGRHAQSDLYGAAEPLAELWESQRGKVIKPDADLFNFAIDVMAVIDHTRGPNEVKNAVRAVFRRRSENK
jgi:hypothetical protein